MTEISILQNMILLRLIAIEMRRGKITPEMIDSLLRDHSKELAALSTMGLIQTNIGKDTMGNFSITNEGIEVATEFHAEIGEYLKEL